MADKLITIEDFARTNTLSLDFQDLWPLAQTELYNFNGSSDFITVPASSAFDLATGSCTIAMLLVNAAVAANKVVWCRGSNGGGGYYIQTNSNNWEIIHNSTVVLQTQGGLVGTQNVPTWVVFKKTGGGSWQVFVQGVELTYGTQTAADPSSLSADLIIGKLNPGSLFYQGGMSMIQYFNRALTDLEIGALSNWEDVTYGRLLFYKCKEASDVLAVNEMPNYTGVITAGIIGNFRTTDVRLAQANKSLNLADHFWNWSQYNGEVGIFTASNPPRSYLLDGSDSRVQFPNSGIPVGDASRSLAFWWKVGKTAGDQFIVGWGLYTENQMFAAAQLSARLNAMSVWGWGHDHLGTAALTIGKWVHVVITYDSTSGELKSYLDGVVDINVTTGDFATSSNGSLNFGVAPDSGSAPALGNLADVMIFNRALTAAEAITLSKGGMVYSGLVFGARCNEVTAAGGSIDYVGTKVGAFYNIAAETFFAAHAVTGFIRATSGSWPGGFVFSGNETANWADYEVLVDVASVISDRFVVGVRGGHYYVQGLPGVADELRLWRSATADYPNGAAMVGHVNCPANPQKVIIQCVAGNIKVIIDGVQYIDYTDASPYLTGGVAISGYSAGWNSDNLRVNLFKVTSDVLSLGLGVVQEDSGSISEGFELVLDQTVSDSSSQWMLRMTGVSSIVRMCLGAGLLWATDFTDSTVRVWDPATGQLLETISLGVGVHPEGIAYGFGSIWVAGNGNNRLYRIDPASFVVIDNQPVTGGVLIGGVVCGNTHVWVSSVGNNSVVKVEPLMLAVVSVIGVSFGPDTSMEFSDGCVYAPDPIGNTLVKIDEATEACSFFSTAEDVSGPYGVAFDESVALFVANRSNNTIVKFNKNTYSLLGTIQVGTSPMGLAYDSGILYVALWQENVIRKYNSVTLEFIEDVSISSGGSLYLLVYGLGAVFAGFQSEIVKVVGSSPEDIAVLANATLSEEGIGVVPEGGLSVNATISETDSGSVTELIAYTLLLQAVDNGTIDEVLDKVMCKSLGDAGYSKGQFYWQELFNEVLGTNYLLFTGIEPSNDVWLYSVNITPGASWPLLVDLSSGIGFVNQRVSGLPAGSSFGFGIKVKAPVTGTLSSLSLTVSDENADELVSRTWEPFEVGEYSVFFTVPSSGIVEVAVDITASGAMSFYLDEFRLAPAPGEVLDPFQPTAGHCLVNQYDMEVGYWRMVANTSSIDSFLVNDETPRRGTLTASAGRALWRFNNTTALTMRDVVFEYEPVYDALVMDSFAAFRWTDAGGYYIQHRQGLGLYLQKSAALDLMASPILVAQVPDPGTPSRIKISAVAGDIKVYFDDILVLEASDSDYTYGSVGFFGNFGTGYVKKATIDGLSINADTLSILASLLQEDSGAVDSGVGETFLLSTLLMAAISDSGEASEGLGLLGIQSVLDVGIDLTENFDVYPAYSNYLLRTSDNPTNAVWLYSNLTPGGVTWPVVLESNGGVSSYIQQTVTLDVSRPMTLQFETDDSMGGSFGVKVTLEIMTPAGTVSSVFSTNPGVGETLLELSSRYSVTMNITQSGSRAVRCRLYIDSALEPGHFCSLKVKNFQLSKGLLVRDYVATTSTIGKSNYNLDVVGGSWEKMVIKGAVVPSTFEAVDFDLSILGEITASGNAGYRYKDGQAIGDFTWDFDWVSGASNLLVGFRWKGSAVVVPQGPPNGGYALSITNQSGGFLVSLGKTTDALLMRNLTVLGSNSVMALTGTVHFKIVARGSSIKIWINGSLVYDVVDSDHARGSFGFMSFGVPNTIDVDNIRMVQVLHYDDYLAIVARFALSETCTGGDLLYILNILALEDSGEGSETHAMVGVVQLSEALTGNESLTINVNALLSDSGSVFESLSLFSGFVISDAALGSDLASLLIGIMIPDSGANSLEELTFRVFSEIAEHGTIQEALSIYNWLAVNDAMSGQEIIRVLVRLLVDDESLTVEELMSVIAALNVGDLGVGDSDLELVEIFKMLDILYLQSSLCKHVDLTSRFF